MIDFVDCLRLQPLVDHRDKQRWEYRHSSLLLSTPKYTEAGYYHQSSNLGLFSFNPYFTAALFFCTYEMMKKLLRPHTGDSAAIQASSHMFAASCGEVVSILVILTRDQNLNFSLRKL